MYPVLQNGEILVIHSLRFLIVPSVGVVLAGAAGRAAGQDSPPLSAGPAAIPESLLFDQDGLTGDWWGGRTWLEERGLRIGAVYIAEFSSVVDGGIGQRGSFRNLLAVEAELDLAIAVGVEGGSVFLQYLSVNADSGGSLDAGDIQVFSNIENDRSLDVIYEMWYQQLFLEDRLRVKVGKVDANSEFAFVDVAGDFTNSSAGFSPTIFAFPTYPDPATAVNIFGTLAQSDRATLTIGYGFYDGAAGADGVRTGSRGPSSFFSDDLSGDYFHIAQVDLAWDALMPEGNMFKDGRLSLGGWYHDGVFDRFDGGTERGVLGFFATGEIRLFDPDRVGPAGGDAGTVAGAEEAPPDRGVYLFAQYGWADDEVSEIGHHLAGGLVWRGPSAGRPDDSVGLYASLAVLSDEPGAGFSRDELALETYYRVQVMPAVFVQPGAVYIVNPSGDSDVDNAVVLSLRVGVSF
jgi:porin